MDSIYDYIFDYLRNQFMKRMGISMRIISAINTVSNLSGWSILQMILTKFGYAKFVNWVFLFSILF